MIAEYYTTTEAAKYCRVHPETIRRAYRDGRLKGYKRKTKGGKGHIKFSLQQLDVWMGK